MINKLAKILLNNIKNNAPEHKIKKLARLLYKVANYQTYKQVLFENFKIMFNLVHPDDLIPLIHSYSDTGYGNSSSARVSPTLNYEIIAQRIANIDRALRESNINTFKIGKLANDLIEKNENVKQLPIIRKIMLENKYVESVKIKTPQNHIWEFKMAGTDHFAHRKFFRGVGNNALNAILDEVIKAYVSRVIPYPNRDESVSYTSDEVKVHGLPLTIAYTVNDMTKKILLISAIPETGQKRPTLSDSSFPGYHILERESETRSREYREEEIKEEQQSLSQKRDISSLQLTEEEKAWLRAKPTDMSEEVTFKVWDPKDTTNEVPDREFMKEWKIKYPKSLVYAVGTANVNKLLQRIGIELNYYAKFNNGYVSTIQIPCQWCRDIDTGKTTSPYVYVKLHVKYTEPPKPSTKRRFYIDTKFSILDSTNIKDPKAFWEHKTRSSIKI